MKLLCFEQDGTRRVGIAEADFVIDLVEAVRSDSNISDQEKQHLADTVSLIGLGTRGMEIMHRAKQSGRARMSNDTIRITSPILPSLILCSGENYWDHRQEKPAVEGKEPEFFLKSPLGVIGPEAAIQLDGRVTRKLDYETELMIVIGGTGRHILPEHALDYVYGYTIMNDVTARDRQVKLRPDGSSVYSLGPGKNFDTSAPIGPYIVTRDEIPDPQNLAIQTRVNGELRQNNNTRKMIWSVAQLVAFFSNYITLRPGVVISTGTPGGTGWGTDAELGGKLVQSKDGGAKWNYLKEGDRVECEIESIGALRNPVAAVGSVSPVSQKAT